MNSFLETKDIALKQITRLCGVSWALGALFLAISIVLRPDIIEEPKLYAQAITNAPYYEFSNFLTMIAVIFLVIGSYAFRMRQFHFNEVVWAAVGDRVVLIGSILLIVPLVGGNAVARDLADSFLFADLANDMINQLIFISAMKIAQFVVTLSTTLIWLGIGLHAYSLKILKKDMLSIGGMLAGFVGALCIIVWGIESSLFKICGFIGILWVGLTSATMLAESMTKDKE